jgi:hypothetical protein
MEVSGWLCTLATLHQVEVLLEVGCIPQLVWML